MSPAIAPQQAYAEQLARMDWYSEMSDDANVARRGREALAVLRKLQPEVDPTGIQWLQAQQRARCAGGFGVPTPACIKAQAERVIGTSERSLLQTGSAA